jgi:prepilin-type N-terminal cleavage/methylation domain-containing protein
MRTPGWRLAQRGGFTLLEVLLAFTIFAVLAAVLYGAFFVGQRAMEKTQHAFEDNQKFRAAIDLLGSYVRSSLPYRSSAQGGELFYAGEETQVEFVSSFSLTHGGRGLAKIRIFAEPAGDGQVIKLEEQVPVRIRQQTLAIDRIDEATEVAAISNTLVLRDRVSDFRLAYLDDQDDRENWRERWERELQKGLPRALRLSYRTENGQEVKWTFPIMVMVLAP